MTRELMLLRHGKSSWSDPQLDDYDRPLKKRGITASKKMGRYMVHHKLRPQMILSSTAKRAAETAVLACEEMGITQRHIQWHKGLYHAHVHTLLEVLAGCPDAPRILLVGHNPGMEELIAYLCGDRIPVPEDGKLLPTAALARLIMPDNWSGLAHGCATLADIVRPRALTRAGLPETV